MRAPRKQAAGGLRAPPTALETPAEVSRAGKPAFVVAEERPGGDTTSYACAAIWERSRASGVERCDATNAARSLLDGFDMIADGVGNTLAKRR